MATLSFGPFDGDDRMSDEGAGDDDFKTDKLTVRFAGRVVEATGKATTLNARLGLPPRLLGFSLL